MQVEVTFMMASVCIAVAYFRALARPIDCICAPTAG